MESSSSSNNNNNNNNIVVTLYLYNGNQVASYFPKSQLPTVQDLKEFVDRASGLSDGYHLFQIVPSHKKLDNVFDFIVNSTVIQIKDKAKNEINLDSVALSPMSKNKAQFTSGTALSTGQYDQIMLAFMFTATNLVGVALLALIYFNLVMFWPYITPFFCAILVGLTLRGPRDKIVKYLDPLSKIEMETAKKRGNTLFMYFRKTKYIIFEVFSNGNIPYLLLGTLFFLTMGLLYSSLLGTWQPVMVGVLILLLLLVIFLIFLSPPTFAAILLLTALILTIGTLAIFGTTSLIQEGITILKLLEPHLHSLSEKRFAADTFMEMMGFGSEYRSVFTSLHETVVNRLNTTWGVNISEISSFSNFTELSTPSKFGENFFTLDDLLEYDYSTLVELLTGSWGVTTREVLMQVSGWVFGSSFYMLKVLARFSTSFYNLVISVTVFVPSLYLFLVSNKNWVSEVVCMFPMMTSSRGSIDDQIREAFTGIVLSTFVTCIVNAMVTYVIVAWAANFSLPFMYTFVNALFTLFPVAYPWVLQVILVFHLYWGGQWLRGAGVTILFMLLAYFDTRVYSYLAPSSPSSSVVFPHQWVSGLSVVMGLYAFGMQGILLGPVLVYLTIILYRAFVDALRDPSRSSSFVEALKDTGRRGSSFFRRT